MDYIPRKDYESDAEDLCNGEQIRINHTNCTAGEDTRGRLYVKRTENGDRILAYCHNCGLSGSYRPSITTTRSIEALRRAAQTKQQRDTEVDYDPRTIPFRETEEWGVNAKTWIWRFGIDDDTLCRYGIRYDEERGIVFPIEHDGVLKGWQERSFDRDKPKYLTKAIDKPLWWRMDHYYHGAVVIVEDILSAIKCTEAGISGVALLGTNLHTQIVNFLHANGIETAYIWLDNDNFQVRSARLKMKKQLEEVGITAKIIKIEQDPKLVSKSSIANIVNNI